MKTPIIRMLIGALMCAGLLVVTHAPADAATGCQKKWTTGPAVYPSRAQGSGRFYDVSVSIQVQTRVCQAGNGTGQLYRAGRVLVTNHQANGKSDIAVGLMSELPSNCSGAGHYTPITPFGTWHPGVPAHTTWASPSYRSSYDTSRVLADVSVSYPRQHLLYGVTSACAAQ